MQLVLDWDGTVTERAPQMMVLERFGAPAPLARAEEGLERGELTLHECIELEFSGLREPLEIVVPWLVEHARIRPGFHELAESHRPLILSTSFEQLIRPVLAREGLDDLELLCNAVDPRPDGWRAIWRDGSQCADCGEPCKRGSLPEGTPVYVGHGRAAAGAETTRIAIRSLEQITAVGGSGRARSRCSAVRPPSTLKSACDTRPSGSRPAARRAATRPAAFWRVGR